jgi:hypothetical protein
MNSKKAADWPRNKPMAVKNDNAPVAAPAVAVGAEDPGGEPVLEGMQSKWPAA